VLAYLIFSFYPTIYTAIIGFTDLKGMGVSEFEFLDNPFQNFITIIKNPTFIESLQTTAIIWIVNFLPQIFFALLFTAWFTSHRHKIKGQGAFKVLFYMPNIITAATLAILFNALFSYPIGPINHLFKILGLAEEPIYFFMSRWTTRGVVAFIQFWTWYGYTMIVLISGVLGMNPELFEASEIDGATGAQTFFSITLPNLRTILLYTLVTSMIGGLQMFDIPRLLNLGGPDNSTLTTSVFIYNQAYTGSYLYNRAAAASMILFVIIAIISASIFYIMRDKYAAKAKKEQKERIKSAKKAARGVVE
jgi:multiple sugar transport system permease protein